jgi:hypothetical protein
VCDPFSIPVWLDVARCDFGIMSQRRSKKHKKSRRDKERSRLVAPLKIKLINTFCRVFKAKTELKQTASTTEPAKGVAAANSKASFIQGQPSPHGDKPQPQVITQVHSTPLIKAATLKAGGIGGDQQHSLLQQQMQQQQQHQQLQQQQPSLVVSVPLSTANVPGVNLPSNTSATIVVSPHQTNNNNNNNSSSSNNNNNSGSTLQPQQPTGNSSSLYQQLTQRNPEQLVSVFRKRCSVGWIEIEIRKN